MSDHEIIALLVKIRERFRQLVEVYRKIRQSQGDASAAGLVTPADMQVFASADRILSDSMQQLQKLPEKPGQACLETEKRAYADQLLREIGDLLQRAMIMDREVRQMSINRPAAAAVRVETPPAGAARERAMSAYGR